MKIFRPGDFAIHLTIDDRIVIADKFTHEEFLSVPREEFLDLLSPRADRRETPTPLSPAPASASWRQRPISAP